MPVNLSRGQSGRWRWLVAVVAVFALLALLSAVWLITSRSPRPPAVTMPAPTGPEPATPAPPVPSAPSAGGGSGSVDAAGPTGGSAVPGASNELAIQTRKIDSLVKGNVGVSAPASAEVGVPFPVFLRVSSEKLAPLLQSLAEEFPENKTVLGQAGVRLTPVMIATVTGLNFDIAPPGDRVQALSQTEPTTWGWEVKATAPGALYLTFTLTGTVEVDRKEATRNFFSYRQKILVQVKQESFVEKAYAFVENNWQWLWTALVIPAAGTLWAFFRARKGPRHAKGAARTKKPGNRLPRSEKR